MSLQFNNWNIPRFSNIKKILTYFRKKQSAKVIVFTKDCTFIWNTLSARIFLGMKIRIYKILFIKLEFINRSLEYGLEHESCYSEMLDRLINCA